MKEEADIKREIAEAKKRLKIAESELKNMDLVAVLAVHKKTLEALGFTNSEEEPRFFFKEQGEYAITLRYNKGTKKFRCVIKRGGREKNSFSVKDANELESFMQNFVNQETRNVETYKRELAYHEGYLAEHIRFFELAFGEGPAR